VANLAPRQYADVINHLQTRDERSQALNLVPDTLKPLVITHVTNYFSRRYAKNK